MRTQRRRAAELRRRKRLDNRNGERKYFLSIVKYKRLKVMGWKKDHDAQRAHRELQGRVTRQKRASDKEAVRTKAKEMLASKPSRRRSKISAKEYALLSRDLRRRMLREMPSRVEVVA